MSNWDAPRTFAGALRWAEWEIIAEQAITMANRGEITLTGAEIVADEMIRGHLTPRPPAVQPWSYVMAEVARLRGELAAFSPDPDEEGRTS